MDRETAVVGGTTVGYRRGIVLARRPIAFYRREMAVYRRKTVVYREKLDLGGG